MYRSIPFPRCQPIGEQKRRVVVRIAAADEGGWKSTFHPIDQTAQPIPIASVILEGERLACPNGGRTRANNTDAVFRP